MNKNLDKIKNDLLRLADNGKLFHAYIFFGESEEEIFEFSKKLANFLEKGEFESRPDSFLSDLSIIQPNEKSGIGIDEIRKVQEFFYQTANSQKRTAIIYGSEGLNSQAQSALLKIIEEPPINSLIILIAKDENVFMPTIVSRCHKIYFPRTGMNVTRKILNKKSADADKKAKATEIDVDEFFQKAILDLRKDIVKNSGALKEMLKRLSLIKQLNLNNKLQIRFLKKRVK